MHYPVRHLPELHRSARNPAREPQVRARRPGSISRRGFVPYLKRHVKRRCVWDRSAWGTLRVMNTEKLTRPWLRLSTSVLAAGGLALSALGLASGMAQAAPPPAPAYHHHWCPGDQWDNGWGNNWDWNNCHDWDDNYGGPAGYGPGGPGYGAPPWAPPPPPPPPWAPWAQVTWNPGTNGWGYWNGPVWVPI